MLAFILMFYFLSLSKNLNILIKGLIIALTSVELLTCYYPYLLDIIQLGEPANRSLKYRGFTGSVNIIAYTLLLKLPFFFYYTFKAQSRKYLYFFYSILIIYAIFYIFQTRSAIISTILISSIVSIGLIINNYKTSNLKGYRQLVNPFVSSFLPLLISIATGFVLSSFVFSQNAIRTIDDRISSLTADDYSFSSRLNFYTHAVESIIDYPIFGVGNGNWEIYSIEKDSKNIEGYTVPYHVHNDFLEISAESGIIGGALYYFIIFYILFLLLRLILKNNRLNKDFSYEIFLIAAFIVYLLDSSFNFPTSRPYTQITFLFLCCIAILHLKMKPIKLIIKKYSFLIIFFLLLIPFSIYASARVYSSSIQQFELLRKYNSASHDIDLNKLETYEMDYPSVTATTVPLKAMKGFFYLKNDSIQKAIELLEEGRKYNPYLYFSDAWISQGYYQLGQIDSSLYYAKRAYKQIPNNIFHFAQVTQSHMKRKDSVALKEFFANHERKNGTHEELYMTAMAAIIDKDETGFVDGAEDLYSNSDLSRKAFYTLNVGYENTMQAATLHALGEQYFLEGDFEEAAKAFDKAGSINKFELPYRENAANAYIRSGDNEKALEILNELIIEDKTISPRSYWLRGLLIYDAGNQIDGCKDLDLVEKSGWIDNPELFQQLCGSIRSQ
jgi:O-antigen ligase/Tfp pilus assembly protein PilF